jgi:tRNA (mo5U34)-methyltransferase
VLGIDHDPAYLRQADWARSQYGFEDRVELRHLPVYDLHKLDRTFDLVLFMGVFYHLRYPLLGLDLVAERVRRLLVFQTLTMPGEDVCHVREDYAILEREPMLDGGWPKMAFIEHRLADDPTNWWAPNHACVEAMLRSSGMRVMARPAHEVYICEPSGEARTVERGWVRDEVRGAAGAASHIDAP